MELIHIKVEGTSPLLLHNPGGMSPHETPGVKTKKQIPTPEVEAAAGRYLMPGSEQLALPTTAFRGCMAGAAKGRKIGKTFATTVVKGAVFPAEEWTPLTDPSGDPAIEYEIDMRRAVIGKAGVVRCRPKLTKWAANVRLEYDDDFLAVADLIDLLNIGGRTVGVGDFRPEKTGWFGRFRVVE